VFGIVHSVIVKVTDENVQKEIDINTEVLRIANSEIVKVTNKNVQKETDILICYFYYYTMNYPEHFCVDIYFFLYILICYFYYVQKEIYINTEVLGIVNSEIVKVTGENVQKEIDINTEVLGIVNITINYP
jgi:hypothetical protein